MTPAGKPDAEPKKQPRFCCKVIVISATILILVGVAIAMVGVFVIGGSAAVASAVSGSSESNTLPDGTQVASEEQQNTLDALGP